MNVRLAIIQPEDLAGVMSLTGDLRKAVNSGDMDGMGAATEKLMAVTAKTHRVDITEEKWRRFLSEVRAENATFQSDYVVSGQLYPQFFPGITADEMVLQLPFSEQEVDDV